MPLEHTPLDFTTMSPDLARAVGPNAPGPAKMMAAKGLVPLGPSDLLTAMYQLALDDDAKVAEAAATKSNDLPSNVLVAGLAAPLDPRVLDFFAAKVTGNSEAVEAILLNRATVDATLLTLARTVKERELEILAGNQQRLLGAPEIIEAIYFNKNARMSSVQRLLEMAARNGLELKKIPHFKKLVAGIMGKAPVVGPEADLAAEDPFADYDDGVDNLFSDAMADVSGEEWEEEDGIAAEEDAAEEEEVPFTQLPVNARIRLATLGSAMHRQTLIKDSNRMVALAAISSPAVSDTEAARYANNRSLSEEVVRYITQRKEWQKNYTIKVSLVNNPKTPLPYSMRMLNHLRMLDLKMLAGSRSIPSALGTAAKRLLKKRVR